MAERATCLSKNDLNKSLSSKKKSKKKSVKVVLAPYELPALLRVPVFSDKDLENILRHELSAACIPRDTEDSSIIQAAKEVRAKFLFGVNSVNRSLQADKVAAVVLAPENNLSLLLGHIASLSNHHNVPVARFQRLREITQESLGFECIVLGVKKDQDSLRGLVDCLIKLLPEHKPSEHAAEDCGMECDDSVQIIDKSSSRLCDGDDSVQIIDESKPIDDSVQIVDETSSIISKPENQMECDESTDPSDNRKKFVLRKRSNIYERVFEPKAVVLRAATNDDSFIKLGTDGGVSSDLGIPYRPAHIIKRYGNPNRKK